MVVSNWSILHPERFSKNDISSFRDVSDTEPVRFSSTASLVPLMGFESSTLLKAENRAASVMIKVMILRTTEPMIKPRVEARRVFPKPIGFDSFVLFCVVFMVFIYTFRVNIKLQIY